MSTSPAQALPKKPWYQYLTKEDRKAFFAAWIGVLLDGAALPVAIEPLQVIVIALVAMAIALLSTLYPSWRAAATQPAEALRYE